MFRNNRFSIIIFLALVLCSALHAEENQHPEAQAWFNRGEASIAAGDTAGALKAFREAVRRDRKFAEAHHRMAEIFLARGTLDDRLNAKWAIREAVRLKPDNTRFLHTYVEWMLSTGMDGKARRTLGRILDLDPGDSRAYYKIGLFYDKEWIRYEDMRSAQYDEDGSFVMNFTTENHAHKDREAALEYYRKALSLNPDLSDACYRIALIHFEKGELDSMVAFLNSAIERNPANADYHLFLGLAYQEQGLFEKARTAYDNARKLMPEEALALFHDIELVASPEETDRFNRSRFTDQVKLREGFWNQRDPMLLTDYNERMIAHFGRIAYANLRYSLPIKRIPGWKTDQGRVYIRYGKPYFTSKSRPGLDLKSYARWAYPDFSFSFESRSLSRNYDLTIPSKEYYDKLIEVRPDMYDPIEEYQKMPLSCSAANFRTLEGSPMLDMYQSLSRETLDDSLAKTGRYLRRGIFLFDGDWQEVYRNITEEPWLYNPENSKLLIGWHRSEMVPGEHLLVVEYLDAITRKIGRYRDSVDVAHYDHSDLCMSDIVLAREIGDFRDPGEPRRGGKRIIPNTLSAYDESSPVLIYFEIYHLIFNPAGTTSYRLDLITERIEEKPDVMRRIRDLFKRDKEARSVTTSYTYSGNVQNEVFFHELHLQQKRAGSYRLTIRVQDLISDSAAEKTIEFELLNAESIKL
jgi:GWxTD domain-containing protein